MDVRELLEERVMILGGAMGTVLQQHELAEQDFRGDRFKTHPLPLKGNNETLSLTRPDAIESVHRFYLESGTDTIETNTFGTTTIVQADYGIETAKRKRIAVIGLSGFITPSLKEITRIAKFNQSSNKSYTKELKEGYAGLRHNYHSKSSKAYVDLTEARRKKMPNTKMKS